MPTFKLTIAYDGTGYNGWQRQPGLPTIQGELERALAEVTGLPVQTTGCSRTDAGVHALGQVVGFEADTALAPPVLARALNARLPPQIVVRQAIHAAADFDAIRQALRKRYRYVLSDAPLCDPFRRGYAWNGLEPLDAARMQRAAQALLGTHDFRSFESQGSPRQSSVRTVLAVDVFRAPAGPHPPGVPAIDDAGGTDAPSDPIFVEIEADGFLYNMVRAIVGTLVEVGRGARPEEWVAEVLAARDRHRAGRTAPAQGLFLLWVGYALRGSRLK